MSESKTEDAGNTTKPADGDEPAFELNLEENLWSQFLKHSNTTTRRHKEGHVVVLGDANSGKTALVSQMGKLEQNTVEMKRFLVMRYSYITLTDHESDEPTGSCNLWQVSEPQHMPVLDELITPSSMSNVAYMICLDLSRPSSVKEQFDKWIAQVEETQTRLLERLPTTEQDKLKERVSSHIQFYINPNDPDATTLSDDEKGMIELQTTIPEKNLGCPIIVVGTKADAFRKKFPAEADANDRYDIIISYIRLWSIKYGAAGFTMAKGLKEQAVRILQYINHRLFDTQFLRAPNVVVSLSNLNEEFLFVPSGFDSEQIISTQAGGRSLETPFEDFFPPSKASQKKRGDGPSRMRASTDQAFLKTMQFDLDKAQSATPESKSASRQVPTKANRPARSDMTEDKSGNAAVQSFFKKLLDSGPSASTSKKQSPADALAALSAIRNTTQRPKS